jgi:hypothetical protein
MQNIDFKKVRFPRHYASDVAIRCGVTANVVYNVRFGRTHNRKVYLELLTLLHIHIEESSAIEVKIKDVEKRIENRKPNQQLSLF